MSTNYYLHSKPDCECCGRPFEPLHIGKSSIGWCFELHVIPEDNINTLNDWRERWSKPGAFIRNEYFEKVSIADMEKIITERKWRDRFPARRQVDTGNCIGQGHGTWDYIVGEFS
jgi:hypothetical protein